jgi:hypothetical protein
LQTNYLFVTANFSWDPKKGEKGVQGTAGYVKAKDSDGEGEGNGGNDDGEEVE